MNCPMKQDPHAAMPQATGRLLNAAKIARTLPASRGLSTVMDGRLNHCHARATAASGTRQKKAARQPMTAPSQLPRGAARTVARALPPLKIARARGTWWAGTSRMAVAADMDQNPPITTPMRARPTMKSRYPGAIATRAPETAIKVVRPKRSGLRFRLPASVDTDRLVRTAKSPEMAMPCPTIPSETWSSAAMGVSRLTGMNSDAISAKTHRDMAKTPPQCAGCCARGFWGALVLVRSFSGAMGPSNRAVQALARALLNRVLPVPPLAQPGGPPDLPAWGVLRFRRPRLVDPGHQHHGNDHQQEPGHEFFQAHRVPAVHLAGVEPRAGPRGDVLGQPDEQRHQQEGHHQWHAELPPEDAEVHHAPAEDEHDGGEQHPAKVPQVVVGEEVGVDGGGEDRGVQ